MTDGIGGPRGGENPDILAALRSGRIRGAHARLEAATQLLEGSFYQEVFKAMRATIPEGGVISGGSGQEMFESLLDQSVADAAAARNDRGLGNALYRYFVGRVQDTADVSATRIADPNAR